MVRLTKRLRMAYSGIDRTKQINIDVAFSLLKAKATANFIESVDVAIQLNIEAHKSTQIVRGSVVLPHGSGRVARVAVFTHGSYIKAAKEAGADMVGMEDLAEKIKEGNKNFDVVIASPEAMTIVSQLAQILGPRCLMPNPKMGTVTSDIVKAVKEAKKGQIFYRNDKSGIVHATIGKIDFESYKLRENLCALLAGLKKSKPTHIKGSFVKKIHLSTTMGVGIAVEKII